MLKADIMKYMSLHLFGLALYLFLLSFGSADDFFERCAAIHPDAKGYIPVELEKEFTAVCNLRNGSKYSADDITWSFGSVIVAREFYTKLNNSAMAVTVNISRNMSDPLKCTAVKQDSFEEPCRYGIYLDKGYPPLKPTDLECIAFQDGQSISSKLSCSWKPGTRDPIIITNYTLNASTYIESFLVSGKYPTSSLSIDLRTFPSHMVLLVSVEAQNELGAVKSDALSVESESFAKPNPPENVRLIPEDSFPRSLMVNWTHPIHETVFKLRYHIRYCKAGCHVWQEISQNLTEAYIESFRLQNLQPYTDYVVQMRCINKKKLGYWSEWSSNATARTPEAKPEGRPDLWRFFEEDNTVVRLIWKDPVRINGKILGYDLTINDSGHSETHHVLFQEHIFVLREEKTFVKLTASNSAGVSSVARLIIQRPGIRYPPGVEQVNCSVMDNQLQVTWLPAFQHTSEYVIEWVSVPNKEVGWQRVSGSTNNAILTELKPFIRYNISVYPIFTTRLRNSSFYIPGAVYTKQTYLKEGRPLSGPIVNVTATGKNIAQLKWNEIPIEDQQGFVTEYSIVYRNKNIQQIVTVPSNTFSYKLTKLASNSQYVVYIMVSNQEGSRKGPDSSFHTKKYDDGEIDIIVVVVCLSFLFVVLFLMYLIIKKKEVLKRRFWPQVPDPSHSTIANWSPECPNKPDSPKESILTEVSVVEVDLDEEKSLCDDDKAVMPLKKYFSEERSSGIGGSSGMSTPRQSVSSNDEADSGQTTASTVQYSAVVGSGYKGQTPGTQAAMFSRSESTQPLLECEENSEHLCEASSDHTNSYFKRRRGLEQLHTDEAEEPSFSSLSFSPMEEEDSPTLTEDPPGQAPGYMPQQNGYRPQ